MRQALKAFLHDIHRRNRIERFAAPIRVPLLNVKVDSNSQREIVWDENGLRIVERNRWFWMIPVVLLGAGLLALPVYLNPAIRAEWLLLWNEHALAICVVFALIGVVVVASLFHEGLRRTLDVRLNESCCTILISWMNIPLTSYSTKRLPRLEKHLTSVRVSKYAWRDEYWIALHAHGHEFILCRQKSLDDAARWTFDHVTTPSRMRLRLQAGPMWFAG